MKISYLMSALLAVAMLSVATSSADARRYVKREAIITCNDRGCSDWSGPKLSAIKKERVLTRKRVRRTVAYGNSNAVVRSSRGVSVRVAPSARAALQCVVDYVEARGVRIKAMRGYGPGTVRGSLHPGGKALDINQYDRDKTRPVVPRSVANAAADKCGVISGARWSYADNGHWNLAIHGRKTQEPWPRALAAR